MVIILLSWSATAVSQRMQLFLFNLHQNFRKNVDSGFRTTMNSAWLFWYQIRHCIIQYQLCKTRQAWKCVKKKQMFGPHVKILPFFKTLQKSLKSNYSVINCLYLSQNQWKFKYLCDRESENKYAKNDSNRSMKEKKYRKKYGVCRIFYEAQSLRFDEVKSHGYV